MLQAAVHFICLITRLTATKVDYLGRLTNKAQRILQLGFERMTTGSV